MKRCIFIVILLTQCTQSEPEKRAENSFSEHSNIEESPASLYESTPGFLGVVLPRQTVDLESPISARIERIDVREGQMVRIGQTIATQDRSEILHECEIAGAALRAADAEIARRNAELSQAENLLTRRRQFPDLFPSEEIRQAELQREAVQADLNAAHARRAQSAARLEQARETLARTELKASADGIVSKRYLDPGAMAGPNRPIVRLVSTRELIVRFGIPPERARTFTPAQRVVVQAENVSWPATIEQISAEVDPPSGLVILIAALENGATVKPGSIVRIHDPAGRKQS